MIPQKKCLSLLLASTLVFGSSVLQAGQAKFSIIPTADSIVALLLPNNFTETVSYQVTNQTKTTRTLTMTPLTGVSQVTSAAGTCQKPFTLAPQQSCTLTLSINGSLIPASGIQGGPVICKTNSPTDPSPDPFLCSQPDIGNTLAVSVTTPGQRAYVANQFASSVSFCQVNPATGFLSQCAVTATGLSGLEGIGFNPAGNYFYSANPGNNTISLCQANKQTGALSSCVNSGGTGFNLPNAIAFSPDGTVLYTANLGGAQSVSACLVNAGTGMLSSCIINTSPTFGAPADMTVNSTGTLAYIANRSKSTISVCKVSGQALTACDSSSGTLINAPEGVTLSPLDKRIYIANAGDKKIIVCDIRQDSTGFLDNCSATDGPFVGTGNVGLNQIGTTAYVPNQLLQQVFACDVNTLDGKLSSCKPSRGTGFVGPAGVVIH
jgi:DNA-binding beta-propeller fold protein YncE